MHPLLPIFFWALAALPARLQIDGTTIKEARKRLHYHMTKREVEYYFGVTDHAKVPEYHVTLPYQTNERGRKPSLFQQRLRRRRSSRAHPDELFYSLHAFGSNLRLRLKKNDKLMAPNLVIERHDREGVVTREPVPKNKFYLGRVASDPGSTVALRSGKGLTGMIKTSRDSFLVQPLPAHLAKHVTTRTGAVPHLVYKSSMQEVEDQGCQTKSESSRLRRSPKRRKARQASDDGYKYLEAALIVPKTYVEKHTGLSQNYTTVLLVIANMVASMYQDPSIGKIKVYYVVTKIAVIDPTTIPNGEFYPNTSSTVKLKRMLKWAASANDGTFEVFSYITNNMKSGGVASIGTMCRAMVSNGNVNTDRGLQTAFTVAHETGHNFGTGHDVTADCPKMKYIMSGTLPTGIYAATWSSCSRPIIQSFLESARSSCLNHAPQNMVAPVYQDKLPGQEFDGDSQCEQQYGRGWKLSPHTMGVCHRLNCAKQGTQLSRLAPVADGTRCGTRSWCMRGECVDNGRPRIDGGWSDWLNDYSVCTRTCGGGVQYRTRTCTNPIPSNGGWYCWGTNKDWKICSSMECAKNESTFREQQCSKRRPSSTPYYKANDPCALACRIGNKVIPYGSVIDGTRRSLKEETLDVCIQHVSQSVGCDHVLQSEDHVWKRTDRCGKCGGNGDACIRVTSNYTDSPAKKGPDNAAVVSRLLVGTVSALYQMRKASSNYLGVKMDNGTFLVGGNLGKKSQTVRVSGAEIVYTHKKAKFRDQLQITGPTGVVLNVVYVLIKGANPGLDYTYLRPAQAEETPSKEYKWSTGGWSSCSASCGDGLLLRDVHCARSDDGTPASDAACAPKKKPNPTKVCNKVDCPSEWYTTHWAQCSRSCGGGFQDRSVICRMKINKEEYGLSYNCSDDDKPIVNNTHQTCNIIACPANWDTEEGFSNDKCGEPIDPATLKCYRIEETGKRTRVPDIFCTNPIKPTKLACTTPSVPTTLRTPKKRPTRPGGRNVSSAGNPSKYSLSVALCLLAVHISYRTMIGY